MATNADSAPVGGAAVPLSATPADQTSPSNPTVASSDGTEHETTPKIHFNLDANHDHSSTNFVHVPPQPIPQVPEIHYYGLALVFLAPALGGFLYGYDIGATSFVLAMLRETRDHDVWWYGFPKYQQGLLVSTLALGALLGSHIVLVYLANSIGRRKEIRIAATLYILGATCNVMSGSILSTSEHYSWGNAGIYTLLFGRLLYGAGVGFIMHGAPTYMAEMSPTQVRGAVVSAKETVIVFGIVVGMLMGDLLSDYPDNWTDLYSFSILGAVPMLLLTFKIPRSKRWLLMKGYREEAKESMQFVYKGNIEDEFDRMAMSMDSICCKRGAMPDDLDYSSSFQDGDDCSHGSVYSSGNGDPRKIKLQQTPSEGDDAEDESYSEPGLFKPQYRPFMLIGIGLLASQQFSGQPSVLAYSRVLFGAAGWQGHANVVTVIIMAMTSAVTVALVDRLGRKILLGLCCLIMTGALLALTYAFWGWDEAHETQLSVFDKRLILIAMFVYIAGYQVGYGPITWCVLSEIFPSEIRGPAMAFSVEVNFLSKFLCQLLFPIIQDLLGWANTFALFACIVVCSLFFIGAMVPETKGLSLEEIQVQMKGIYGVNTRNSTMPKSYESTLDSPLIGSGHVQRGLTPIV